jgi:hypothetical protein
MLRTEDEIRMTLKIIHELTPDPSAERALKWVLCEYPPPPIDYQSDQLERAQRQVAASVRPGEGL